VPALEVLRWKRVLTTLGPVLLLARMKMAGELVVPRRVGLAGRYLRLRALLAGLNLRLLMMKRLAVVVVRSLRALLQGLRALLL
jgi:hypothetical protein